MGGDSRLKDGHPPDWGWKVHTTECGLGMVEVRYALQIWGVWVMRRDAIFGEWPVGRVWGVRWGPLRDVTRLMSVGRFQRCTQRPLAKQQRGAPATQVKSDLFRRCHVLEYPARSG